MINLVNIYESIATGWGSNSPPLIAGWQKEGATRPYGIVDIIPGDTQWNTGDLYDQDYYVTITLWNNDSIGAAYALGQSAYSLFNVYYKLQNLNNAWTLQIRPLPMEVIVDDERDLDTITNQPIEVFKITCKFLLTLNETRNT